MEEGRYLGYDKGELRKGALEVLDVHPIAESTLRRSGTLPMDTMPPPNL